MGLEEALILLYLLVDDAYRRVTFGGRLRQRGPDAYFHRFRPVVFIETDHPCSRKPASRFHDFGQPFSPRTAHVGGELGV